MNRWQLYSIQDMIITKTVWKGKRVSKTKSKITKHSNVTLPQLVDTMFTSQVNVHWTNNVCTCFTRHLYCNEVPKLILTMVLISSGSLFLYAFTILFDHMENTHTYVPHILIFRVIFESNILVKKADSFGAIPSW